MFWKSFYIFKKQELLYCLSTTYPTLCFLFHWLLMLINNPQPNLDIYHFNLKNLINLKVSLHNQIRISPLLFKETFKMNPKFLIPTYCERRFSMIFIFYIQPPRHCNQIHIKSSALISLLFQNLKTSKLSHQKRNIKHFPNSTNATNFMISSNTIYQPPKKTVLVLYISDVSWLSEPILLDNLEFQH